MLTLQESIRPSADLRNHYAEISKQCKENKEAVIITVNGRGDTVALSYEEYKNMKARIELLEVLAEAEDDVKNERVAPITETFDDLRKMLQEDNDEVLVSHCINKGIPFFNSFALILLSIAFFVRNSGGR